MNRLIEKVYSMENVITQDGNKPSLKLNENLIILRLILFFLLYNLIIIDKILVGLTGFNFIIKMSNFFSN